MNLSNRVKKLELMQKILLEDKLIDTERDIESELLRILLREFLADSVGTSPGPYFYIMKIFFKII